MPSTPSPILALEYQANGENENTWNDKYNNLFGMLEGAATGVSALPVSDSATTTVSLTNFTKGTFHNIGFKLTGTLTAVRTVEFPAKPKVFAIWNATSGGYAVNVRIAGGSSTSVANGAKALFMSDGSTLVAIANDALGGASSLAIAGESITSGTVPIARLPVASSGTSSTSLVVRSDDSRLTNERAPTNSSVTWDKIESSLPASQAAAEGGSNNTSFMTPLRTAQYAAAQNILNARYSTTMSFSAGPSAVEVSHGLASIDGCYLLAHMYCIDTDAGYSANDIVDIRAVGNLSTTTQPPLWVFLNSTYVGHRRPSSAALTLPHKSTYVDTSITTSKWRLAVSVIAPF